MPSAPVRVALRCLKLLVQNGPADVTREAARELNTAAANLLRYRKQQRNTAVDASGAHPLPAELVQVYITAVTALNTHLREQQQQPEWQSQQQQQCVAELAGALLSLWDSFATLLIERWVPHIVSTTAPATELALLVLTGPQGGLAPETDTLVFSIARRCAAATVRLVAACMQHWAAREATNEAATQGSVATHVEAVWVSDIVQQAIILHLAVLVYACRQQQQQQQRQQQATHGSSSSSSNWAPTEAKRVLWQLGFPLDLVQHYTSTVCPAVPEAVEPEVEEMLSALSYMQHAINARVCSLQHGEWAAQYARSLAAAEEAHAAAVASTEAAAAANAGSSSAVKEVGRAVAAKQQALARAAAAAVAAVAEASASASADAAGAAGPALQTLVAVASDITTAGAELAAAVATTKDAAAAAAAMTANAAAALAHYTAKADASIAVAQRAACPDFTLAQLVYLGLESISVLGIKQDRLEAAVEVLFMMARLLANAGAFAVVDRAGPDTEVARVQAYAEGCVGYVWLGLGKQLQRASGVAEADLEGYSEQRAAVAVAAAAAATAAAGGPPTSSCRGCDVTQAQDDVRVPRPADAAVVLQMLWSMHARCLFSAISLYQVMLDKLPYQVYMRQPMRASRVIEAAARAVFSQDELALCGLPDTTMLAGEATWSLCITANTTAAHTPSALLDRRFATRSCSQLISALKVVSRPLPAEVGGECVIRWGLQLACRVAVAGPRLHARATGAKWIQQDRSREVTQQLAVAEAAKQQLAVPEAAKQQLAVPEAATQRLAVPEAATQQLAVAEAATQQLAVAEAATQRLAVAEAATQRLAVAEAATQQLAVAEAATQQLAVAEAATQQLAVAEAATQQLAVAEAATQRLAVAEAATQQLALAEAATQRLAVAEAATQQLAVAEAATQQPTEQPGALAGTSAASANEALQLSTQEALSAPCYSAWLAATGRALLTVGRLLANASSWLQQRAQSCTVDSSLRDTILQLDQHALAAAWLQQQLHDLQQHPSAASAAGVPPEMLQELGELANTLMPQLNVLSCLCDDAVGAAVAPKEGRRAAEAAVFQAYQQACAEGWLPEGLQQLGAKVWAAWPQKYACNDDRCINLSDLTEQACAKLKCTGCKAAYYCCKEHQVRHWKQHKQVCKHLQQLATLAAAGDG